MAQNQQQGFSVEDPLSEIPRELDPDFFTWKKDEEDFGFPADAEGIRSFGGRTLLIAASGGKYQEKALALASRQELRGLCIDGRNVPQPLIDAVGKIPGLERIHLGFIGKRSLLPLAGLAGLKSMYLEGAKGRQGFSIRDMAELRSVLVGGDFDAVSSLMHDGNAVVRYLALGGTSSANLRLPDLEFLKGFPGLEYLALLDVSVKSRSLEPCLALPQLRGVILNYSRSWRRESIEALEAGGVWVRCRMDEISAQLR